MPISFKNTASQYGLISQFFHWSVAFIITLQFVWAWRIEQLGLGRARYELVNEHKSMGLTIFMLVVLRLLWRFYHAPPPLPEQIPYWQQQSSRWVHGFLYALLLCLPLVGWAMSSAAGFVVSWFNLIDLPALMSQNEVLKERLMDLHALLAWSLALLVTGHILMALHHHFVKKDEVLRRMLPRWRK